ncbi:hypothetical protein ACHAXA_005443 [Cyclostephanos tholiformis]|uniref:Uncharacterized protein n=1 Tax=Cyclostephanos tholiformis TaxID=382380 RepID=A0ABD3R3T0_9STRA
MAPATTTTPHQTALLSRHGRGGSSLRRRRRPRHGISVNEDGADACMLSLLDRTDIDHRGLAKSFDVEYALEEAKRGFTFWQVLERERNCRPEEISGKSSDMSPLFSDFQTISPERFDDVVKQIAPNFGVLYAITLALTLEVLYQRFMRIQERATNEASLLSQITRNLLTLFASEPEWAIDSCQMVANQIHIILSRTRGVELLSIMKADPYENLLAIVDNCHYLRG